MKTINDHDNLRYREPENSSEHQSTGFSALGEAQPAAVNAKHTPGPYYISAVPGDHYIQARVNGLLETVAIVTGWPSISTEEHSANKELFRSAPTLLRQRDELKKALKAMLDYTRTKIDSHRLHELGQIENNARVALANCEKENQP